MTILKLQLSFLDSIKPSYRGNMLPMLKVNCTLLDEDVEDLLAQICEQIGDEDFKYLTGRLLDDMEK